MRPMRSPDVGTRKLWHKVHVKDLIESVTLLKWAAKNTGDGCVHPLKKETTLSLDMPHWTWANGRWWNENTGGNAAAKK